MALDVIKVFWPIVFVFSSLAAAAYARWINQNNVSKAQHAATEARLADAEKELAMLSTKLDQLPTARDISRLGESIAHMSGQFEGLGLVIARLHEHMLDKDRNKQ